MHRPNTTQKRTTWRRVLRKIRSGRSQQREEPKTHKQKKISNNYWQNCLDVITGCHCWWGENAIGLVSKTDLTLSTPHPLQPDAYYPVTELFKGWTNGQFGGRTDPGSFNWRAARAGPILGAFIWNSGRSKLILEDFTGLEKSSELLLTICFLLASALQVTVLRDIC